MSPLLLFTVTDEHIALLRRANVWWDSSEFGAPAIDSKRPYGNGDVRRDVAKILGWPLTDDALTDAQHDRAAKIHEETEHALGIFLSTGTMEPGTYQKIDWRTWKKVEPSPSPGENG